MLLTARVKLHQAQREFLRSEALYRGFVGGIGSGKSWAGAYDLLRRSQPGRLYMVAAPTYPMLRDATLRTFLGLARDLHLLAGYARGEMIATLATGAEVLFRSADDPEKLRGPNLSGMWLDEASLMSREVFDISIGRLREAGEQGWLSATFTPKGRQHWTYEVFAKGTPGSVLFRARTKDNPFLASGFADQLALQYTGLLADQELGGLFVDVAGAEWPSTYFPDSAWFDDWPSDLVIRTAALDPSKGKDAKSGDYSAYVLLGRCREGKLWVEADLARRPTERIIEDVLEHQRVWRAEAVGVEVNQFQELLAVQLAARARQTGMPLPVVPITNTVNKQVRIRRLGPYLAQGIVRFRNTPGTRLLVEQLREFPECDHDDGPDALEVALRVMVEAWNGRQASRPTRARA
jgi:PBSX family phage terminase large subunit